jgi:hypothetical protein
MADEKQEQTQTQADESVYRQADDANEARPQNPTDDHGTGSDADTGVTGTTPQEGGGDAPGGTPDSPSTGVEGTTPTEGGG